MTRNFGRSSARNKALQERRQVREQGAALPATRLAGVCALCGKYHPFPEMLTACPRCGEDMCWGGCACEGRET